MLGGKPSHFTCRGGGWLQNDRLKHWKRVLWTILCLTSSLQRENNLENLYIYLSNCRSSRKLVTLMEEAYTRCALFSGNWKEY